MKQTKAAQRYAKSFLSLSKERNAVDATQNDMDMVRNTIHGSEDFRVMLKSPVIKAEKKLAVISKVFEGKIGSDSQDFIALIVKSGRSSILAQIASQYVNMCKEGNHIYQADVVSAFPLTDSQKDQIMAMASKIKTGTFEIKESIDPKLIGGFILKIGDQMIDASVRKQLRSLRQEMTDGSFVSN